MKRDVAGSRLKAVGRPMVGMPSVPTEIGVIVSTLGAEPPWYGRPALIAGAVAIDEPLGIPGNDPLGMPADEPLRMPADEPLGIPADNPIDRPAEREPEMPADGRPGKPLVAAGYSIKTVPSVPPGVGKSVKVCVTLPGYAADSVVNGSTAPAKLDVAGSRLMVVGTPGTS